MRLFLAVHPGKQFQAMLTTRLDPFRAGLDLAWMRPESWHLTLQFLGDWSERRLNQVAEALNTIPERDDFLINPGLVGAFPELGRPRVLFLHMNSDGQLAKLAADVRKIVNRTWPDGCQDNRPFRGHLTLARVRRKLSGNDLKSLGEMNLGTFDPIAVNGFSLMASELGREGATHEIVAFYSLRKKGE